MRILMLALGLSLLLGATAVLAQDADDPDADEEDEVEFETRMLGRQIEAIQDMDTAETDDEYQAAEEKFNNAAKDETAARRRRLEAAVEGRDPTEIGEDADDVPDADAPGEPGEDPGADVLAAPSGDEPDRNVE